MKSIHLTVAAVVLAASATTATAQERVAQPLAATGQATDSSPAQAAIDRAAAAQKYIFLFFWREKNPQTGRAWSTFEAAAAKLADSADMASIQITSPAEKRLVDKYDVSRSPMPLVLAVAPNGAITGGFPKQFDESQLRNAFVSPCTAACMKALQDRKLVLLCVEHTSPQVKEVSPQEGVQDFTADPQYADSSAVVMLDADDPAEASFLKDLRVDPKTDARVTVLMAPPAAIVGAFVGDVTAAQLAAKLKSAQSGCCPGGTCPAK